MGLLSFKGSFEYHNTFYMTSNLPKLPIVIFFETMRSQLHLQQLPSFLLVFLEWFGTFLILFFKITLKCEENGY